MHEKRNAIRRLLTSLFALPVILAVSLVTTAENWPQWRGPHLNGVSQERNLPLRWSAEENIAWRLPLPGASASTPVIWGNRVFLNVPEDKEIYLWCVEKRRGSLLWKKPLRGEAGELRTHPKHNPSSPSPVTDGRQVYALTAYGALRSFEVATGREVWTRDLQQEYGKFGFRFGFASSPLLFEEALYVQVLREAGSAHASYILRLDKRTGKTVWKVDFPAGDNYKAAESYTTPTIARVGKSAELVINGADQVTGHDLATGRELWRLSGLSPQSPPSRIASSPVVADGVIYAPASFRPLVALRVGGRGNLGDAERLWTSRSGPDIPSPVTDGRYLYIVNDKGIMRCLDAKSGSEVCEPQRLRPGNYSASPVLADDRLYVVSEEGLTTVVKVGAKFEILAENPLNDACLSSPAVSDGQLFIRTAQYLYCIGKPSAK